MRRGIDLLIRNRKYEFNLTFKLLFNLDCIGFNDKDSSKRNTKDKCSCQF